MVRLFTRGILYCIKFYKTTIKMDEVSSVLSQVLNSLKVPSIPNSVSLGALQTKWHKVICNRYSEPARHYHTLSHVKDMLLLRDRYADSIENGMAVDLAIVFHDVIYDPKKGDNEEESAKLFGTFSAEIGLDKEFTKVVSDWIIQTKNHKTDAHTTKEMYGDGDIHYFLDMDMAVLGWENKDYKRYASQIRQEYIHVLDGSYHSRRAQVLRTFLETPNIFATKHFRDHFEQKARENIRKEIHELESWNSNS